MSNTPIAQVAISTIKGSDKQDIYPKTVDKAVFTTDVLGNEKTLNKVLMKGIEVNGETITPDENGVVSIDVAMIDSIETEESQEDGGTNTVTIVMNNGDEYSFQVKNGDTGATGPQGPAGPQGNSGYSGAAGELEVVNNLEDGGTTSALSAQQGVVLKGMIESQTFPIVDNLRDGGHTSALSAEMGKVLGEQAAAKQTINIPFDGGNRYIKNEDGAVTNNNSWISTQYIPVSEGDEFVYSGTPGSASIGVAGYAYDEINDIYTYVVTLTGPSNSAVSNKVIIIPSSVTHILAVDKKSGSCSLTTTKSSTLSRISDALGYIATTTVIDTFITGSYIKGDGQIGTASGAKYALFDVEIGDVIELYDYKAYGTGGLGEATISKKLTATTFQPLLVKEAGTYNLIQYTATENMTVAVSVYRDVRMIVVRSNKCNVWDATTEGLAETRTAIDVTNTANEQYDIKLGYMFENIAVIGDSMSRGTLGSSDNPNLDNDGTGLSSFGASWLSFLSKRWGCKSKFHYANSGTSTYTWLNNSMYGLGNMLADTNIYNAYFIAYGHNDAMSDGEATDEAAPVTITNGTPSCPDGYSFCAYYKAIINQIRTKAPHAMIFCLSEYDNIMYNNKHDTKRQAVIDIAEWYYDNGDELVHHLETGGVPDNDLKLGTHYSTVGYAYIARMVDKCVNEVVYQHRSDTEIKYFGSYNTDHTADSPWE